MGTPEFAVPSLEKLIEEGHEVTAVVTQPDRRKGRGKKISSPPVKKTAVKNNIKVMQPVRIRKKEVMDEIASLEAELFVTCAYGQILPKKLLDIPPLGCINIPASLLPKYRGAAPIQRAIMNGEEVTGITTMMTDEGMDTGDILLKKKISIAKNATAGDLHDVLMHEGAGLLARTLDELAEGTLEATPQDDEKATYAPMIKKEEGLVDWDMGSKKIYDRIRAFTPWPGSFTYYEGTRMKILAAGYKDKKHRAEPGTIIETDDKMLSVACKTGIIEIYRLQFENSSAMDISQCWHNLKAGKILGREV